MLVPESRDPKPGRSTSPARVLSIAALVALVYGVIEAPEHGLDERADPRLLRRLRLVLAAAFVRWELRTPDPMLNLSFFRNPRFSIASGGISLAFFSLFGSIFALTQFLQDAKGYSALEAGAAMTPLAFGLVIGAGSGIKLDARLGTTRVVAAGLLGLGGLLASSLALDASTCPTGRSALWFFVVAMSMGWIMGPATDSVMGAVPEEKSGVASAMNDVTRQVAGALGTAVIGSLITSLYASRIGDSVAGLPEQARVAAEDSIGQANAIAEQLPAEQGASLAEAAADAFTQALGIGFTVAGAAALVAAIVVKLLAPRAAPHRGGRGRRASPGARAPRAARLTDLGGGGPVTGRHRLRLLSNDDLVHGPCRRYTRQAAVSGPDAQLQPPDVARPTAAAPPDPQRRARAAVAIDHVARVRGVGLAARGVVAGPVDRAGDLLAHEQLARVDLLAAGVDLQVDVRRAPAVPAREDRVEADAAGRVGLLVAAQVAGPRRRRRSLSTRRRERRARSRRRRP